MKKLVLKCTIEDEKSKRRVLKVITAVERVESVGLESVGADMKEKKITVIGDTDPVLLMSKLRKFGYAELLSVGPAKEEKKEGEKRQSDAKNKVGVKHIVDVPSSHKYRRFVYTYTSDENPNTCVVS